MDDFDGFENVILRFTNGKVNAATIYDPFPLNVHMNPLMSALGNFLRHNKTSERFIS